MRPASQLFQGFLNMTGCTLAAIFNDGSIPMQDWIIPGWPAPANVKALFTTRSGGVSSGANGAYASLNLGAHVNDDPAHVTHNRALLRRHLPNEPKWLKQEIGRASCRERV